MNISKILGFEIGSIIDSAGKAFDSLFTSDDERNKALNILTKIKTDADIKIKEISNEYEKNITQRWESDNGHFITRLVRPLIVVFLYVLFGAVVLSDGNIGAFKINAAYIPVLQTLLVTVTVAYFGSRGLEKTAKIVKKD